ncbi:MAG: GGDEF domain-containing protein [Gammaproteobacteria bacterium]|nr:GGDEF domain-containing protein [Gammaproteobacteria bacterium]
MQNKITILGILLAIIFWIVDAFIDSLFSENGTSFLQSCFNPDGQDIWMRTFVVLLFLVFSAYTERLLSIIHNMTIELKEYHDRLEKTIAQLKVENIERQRAAEELEELSITDPLTSIYNRRKFNELLTSEVERSKRYKNDLAIIMCDIDHFKKINDTYGHDVGDKALKTFSEMINKNIREVDMFARWGGEEFMILMPNVNTDNAYSVAEKLRKAVASAKIESAGSITASFGVTDLNPDESIDSFIKRVDQAMYRAKDNGRNKVERA